jgi:hypothetical protein
LLIVRAVSVTIGVGVAFGLLAGAGIAAWAIPPV